MDYVCKFTNSKKHMDIIIDIDKREVGSRLLEIRKDHNDTQKCVANIIGIDQSNYSRYELGKNLILTSLLIVFCKYYNVSMDYVCGRSNNKEINEI